MSDARTDAEERFPGDIAQHQMQVIRDDGLYRHLRFSRPNTRNMSFDIITWPGYLAYVGDMGDYVFERVEDMLTFFRHDRINPSYWSEKVQASCRDGIKEYDADLARAWVKEQLDDYDADEQARAEAEGLCYDDGEHELRSELRSIDFSGFSDSWEANFQGFTFRYIWCCLALVWAVKQYDATKVDAVPHG